MKISIRLLCLKLLIVSASSIAFDVKCKFKEDFVWRSYSCDVIEWKNVNRNARISKIEGEHFPQYINDDVLTLRLENLNDIRYFTSDIFLKFRNIKNLVVHSTTLRYLLRGDFILAQDLMNVHMTHNEITALEDYCFSGAVKLKTLNLRENKITDITENAFKGLTTLKFLTLTSNLIQSLHSNTFNDQIYMEQLSLSSNSIQYIDVRLFSKNRNLEVVFLDNNQLTFIDGKLFENNLKMREVYMDNNRIKQISHVENFLVNLKDLEVAVFTSNECVDIMLFIMNRLHPIYSEVFKNCR